MVNIKGHLKSPKGYVLANQKVIWLSIGAIIVVGLTTLFLLTPLLRFNKGSSRKDLNSNVTANAQTFKNKDGTLTSKIYSQPINYKDSKGQWQRIDTNYEIKGSKLEVNKTPYSLSFSKDINKPVTFRVGSRESGDGSVSFQLTGIATPSGRARNDTNSSLRGAKATKQSQTVVTANKVLYKNVYTNTDVERIATSTGLKQNYILKDKGHQTTFKETLSTKLTPKLQKNGSMNFYKGNELVATAPRPFLTDAKGKTVNLNYQLAPPTPDSRLLTLRLPRSLSGLKYPITVDPTITIPRYYGDYTYYPADTFVDSYAANQNFDSQTTMWVGKRGDGFNYGNTMSLLKFGLSLIPAGATINSATLYVRVGSESSYTGGMPSNTIQVQSIDSSWTVSTVTWNNKPPYGNFRGASRSSTFPSSTYVGWNVTTLVSEWASNTRVNNGLALVKTAGEEYSYVNFWSSNYPASRYPYISVTYTLPPPDSTPPNSNITDPTNGSFIKGNYQIKGTASDNEGGTGLKKVEISTNGGSSWNEAALGLSGNWTYYWATSTEGVFNIKSRAIDNADNYETLGSGVTVTVDNADPTAAITSPTQNQTISGSFDITGSADDTNFDYYKVEYGEGSNPSNWTKVGASETIPVTDGKLKTINFGAGNGQYTFKLTVVDKAGNIKTVSVTVTLNNPAILSPHANYTQDPEQCAVCHSSHTATVNRLLRASQNVVYQADFCYSCHDGTGSQYNVKSAYDNNPSHHPISDEYYLQQATYPDSSGHQQVDHKLDCTNCHDPHGVKKPDGTYYPKLLKSVDLDGNKFYEGNEFCGACHGQDSTLIGGDHLTEFTNITHNTLAPSPLSGTKIKCLNCHGNNNSSDSEGTAPHGSDYSRLTKLAEENVCFQCHDNAINSENNINIQEILSYPLSLFPDTTSWLSARHNVSDSEQADADPDTVGDQPSKVECTNCHNPHKNDRGEKKIANPDDIYNLYTQKRNDPKLWDYQDNKGFAIFMPFYRQRAQDLGQLSANKLWSYQGPQTPADGQDTYVDSSKPNTSQDISATSPGWADGTELPTPDLAVGKKAGGNLRSLILFTDVAKIPPGSTVTKAYLAWPTSATTPLDSTKPPISIYRITSPWVETITWNSRPLFDSLPVLAGSRGAIVSYNGVDYLSFDITSLAQGWVNASYNNYGLMLMSPDAEAGSSDYYVVLSASELPVDVNGLRDAKLALIVEYTTTTPPQVQDINGFCLTCHDGSPPSNVVMPNISKVRRSGISDWITQTNTLNVNSFARTDSSGDVHGGQASIMNPDIGGTWEGTTIGSYRYGMDAIQCTDCHDAHGNDNAFHFKKNINWIEKQSIKDAVPEPSTDASDNAQWKSLCKSCHIYYHIAGSSGGTGNCTYCHFHGAKADADSSSSPVTNF